MKREYFFFILLISFANNAQIINIPDPVFKTLLLQPNSTAVQTFIPVDLDMNHDQELQVSEALLIKNLFLNNKNINSLSGIEYFTNLEWLYCNNNNLTSLNLTASPDLSYLDCGYNELTSLNIAGLGSLYMLNCDANQLTSLDLTGCNALGLVSCTNNGNIAALEVSQLSNLINLKCSNNKIPELIFNPNAVNLNYVSCSGNLLTTLILPNANPINNLVTLICNDNLLTDLTVVGHPDLQTLKCYNNHLTNLTVSGLTALQELACYDNQLTTLLISDFPVLDYVNCGNNQLNSVQLTGVPNIQDFYCQYNYLVDLNLSQLYKLKRLACTNNPLLTTLNVKNGSYELNMYLDIYIRFICADENQSSINGNQLDNASYLHPNCVVSSYCSFVPGGVFYTLQGAIKYDFNDNGCDSDDIQVTNQKVKLRTTSTGMSPTEVIRFTDPFGNYFQPAMAGYSTLTPILENPTYFTVSPASASVSFPTTANPYNQDFCIAANGVHNDLQIELMPSSLRAPGFNSTYYINYKNKGTAVQSGSIQLAFDDGVVDLITAVPSQTEQSTGTLSWDFVNLVPFESRQITLTFRLNAPTETPPLDSGAVVQYNATILGLADETPVNNSAVFDHRVVNSHDPNDKTCLEGITVDPQMVGKEVRYLIRFENTGTANAQNIVVADLINTNKFDINSIMPISGSHPFVTKITDYNKVEFVFENINLPFDDSNNDGFIEFKIKTLPTLVLGDTFSNKAYIYFDYNFPVITNNYTTTIAALANQDFEFGTYFTISPNPAKDFLNLERNTDIDFSFISIYNVLGQLVLLIPDAMKQKSIDVSGLKRGNYFLKIQTKKGSLAGRFEKE